MCVCVCEREGWDGLCVYECEIYVPLVACGSICMHYLYSILLAWCSRSADIWIFIIIIVIIIAYGLVNGLGEHCALCTVCTNGEIEI